MRCTEWVCSIRDGSSIPTQGLLQGGAIYPHTMLGKGPQTQNMKADTPRDPLEGGVERGGGGLEA